ncbi:MAG TPA: tetratricopeptide repeat protein [Sphingomonadaceae bacterium]|nr:tetratricopeptide repeat protein [Sphingomonadaceae bacterium]
MSALADCPLDERDALIERLGRGDPSFRAELESLLHHLDADPDFLERPPPGSMAMLLDDDEGDDPLVGEVVGAWVIRSRIDRGGMGAVYLGERRGGDFSQYAAIKVIALGMNSEAIIARFHAERRILAALDHPNIASILDGGVTEDGRPWFAMRYLEGALPVDRYAEVHGLPLKERLRLMLPICESVQFAHQNLIIHRDIKPANILVTPQGVPVLLDFGIAKLLGADNELTGATRLFTPEFASPEQRSGDNVTTATDVYQLGMLLFQLLCGQRPPTDDQGTVSARRPSRPSEWVVSEQARPGMGSADGLRRLLRGDLDTICQQALHPEPQRRYRSAEALADDLSRFLDGLPVRARPDTLTYRVGKLLLRNRWSASLAAALFVVAIGFGVFASLAASRIAEQSRAVNIERNRAQATADFLTDLFIQADPTRSERDFTAAEMLERGLDQLGKNDSLEDSERAAVLTAIGSVLQVRGDHERARSALAEAVELERRRGADSESYLGSLLELAKAEHRLENYIESERLARAALVVADDHSGVTADDRASVLNQLAVAVSDQGRFGEAAEILEQVIAVRETLPGAATDQDLAANYNNLGLSYTEMGRLDLAEQAYDASLKIVEQRFGQQHPYGAFLRHSRAGLHKRRGDLDSARSDLIDALDIAVKTLGEEHPFVFQARDELEAIDSRRVP